MTPELHVLPGPGAVIRDGRCLAVLVGEITADLVSQTQAKLQHAPDDAGFRALVGFLMGVPLGGAAVARVDEAGGTIDAFAIGAVTITTTTGAVTGTDGLAGVSNRCSLDELVAIGSSASDPSAVSWQAIESGAVAGAGFAVERADGTPPPPPAASRPSPDAVPTHPAPAAAPPPPPPPPPPSVPADAGADADYKIVSLGQPVDLGDLQPLPDDTGRTTGEVQTLPAYARPVTVLGVLSPTGHFNHPDAIYCSRTGVKMGASHTRALVQGERPPLGVITFDSGTTYSVQHNTVLGREPETDPRVISEEAAPLSIVDEGREISRQHVLLDLVDWDVYVTDLDTANGTYLRENEGSEPRRLGRGERALLNSGAEVYLGSTRFVYHEHHVR
jgi:hypothetical protein